MSSLITLLREHGTQKLFRAGEPLLFQGEIPRNIYVIVDGIVRGYTISSSGEERVIGISGKGDLIPLAWALGATNAAFNYYEALSDTRVLSVSKVTFDELLESDQTFARLLSETSAKQYSGAVLRTLSLTQSRAIDKLAYTLYYLANRFGKEREDGTTLIDFKLTQILLASMIGQTREGTARNLKELVSKKAVSYSGSAYYVDTSRLLSLLGEEDFRDLL